MPQIHGRTGVKQARITMPQIDASLRVTSTPVVEGQLTNK
jgi:hypothetical protein